MNDSKPKHTPGPWIAVGALGAMRGPYLPWYIKAPHLGLDCYIAEMKAPHKQNEKANARLIAASPELFEIVSTIYNLANLQALLETKYSKSLVNDIMKTMQEALDKVEGDGT